LAQFASVKKELLPDILNTPLPTALGYYYSILSACKEINSQVVVKRPDCLNFAGLSMFIACK